MIKATAGGGGRGMRLVTDAGELPRRAAQRAERRRTSAFGEPTR